MRHPEFTEILSAKFFTLYMVYRAARAVVVRPRQRQTTTHTRQNNGSNHLA